MADIREAFKKALNSNPDSPLVEVISGTKSLDVEEAERGRYIEQMRKEPIKWMNECNAWYLIGRDYLSFFQTYGTNRRQYDLAQVKSRAGRMIWDMSFWEIPGVIHLLTRFNDGLTSHSMKPIIDSGNFVDNSQAGLTSSPNVRRFVDSFKELTGENASSIDDFIDQKLVPQQRAVNSYLPVVKILPAVAEWVKSKYPQSK